MKHFTTLFLFLFAAVIFTYAQDQALKPEVAYPVYFDISPPLRDMIKQVPPKADNSWKDGIVRNKFYVKDDPDQKSGIPGFKDAAVQTHDGYSPADTTIQNFDGVNNVGGYTPPDTDGDVGPNHYFQVVNCSYAIYNKTGAKLVGPLANSSVWSGMPNNSNDGDAVVLYDEIADRWIFTQFSLPNYPSGPYFQMIAVSQTPDPMGSWYRYQYQFDKMPDYPKFGIWPDGYYMGCNRFSNGSSYAGIGADGFDRTAMLAGSPTATRVSFTLASSNEAFTTIPADCDGAFPPLGTPEYFTYIRNSGSQHLGIYEFHADWVTPSNSTFGSNINVPVTPYTWSLSGGIAQQGTGNKVDAITDRLMYRVQFRAFSGYNAMVLNHTVNVGSNIAGIRWYELRNTSTTPWAIYQQSTYGPSDNRSRWMGSIAMDPDGNIALGYSISSSTMFPGIRYTGRMVNDPLGEMTIMEHGIINGGGSQTGGQGRWGDYSSMRCDPSTSGVFWYTTEYYTSTSSQSWKTRIGSFSFASVLTVGATANPSVVCADSASQLDATATGGSGIYTYSWTSYPAGFTSTVQNPVVNPNITTAYIVEVNDGSATKTDSVVVDVIGAATANAGNDTIVCWYVTPILLGGNATSYSSVLWTTSGDGVFTNDTALVTEYLPGMGDKTSGSVDLTLTPAPVSPCMAVVADIKHVTLDPCTGIVEAVSDDLNLSIKPNPAHGTVTLIIDGLKEKSAGLTISNLDGKTLYSATLSAKTGKVMKTIDLSGFARGVYLVKVLSNGQIQTKQLIVQ